MSWSDILKEIANNVLLEVQPLLGTEESRENVGLGASGDVTKRIDAVSENVIIEYLMRKGISCIFVGEESGTMRIGDNPEVYFIVDSVDGTTNAVRGISFTSTSIAVSYGDDLRDVEAALVMRLDNGGIYEAEKGRGARYNGERIEPSGINRLEEAVISIDISRSPENVERLLPLMKRAKHIRSLGSAALEICLVASGQLDAYVDVRGKLRTTDIAAATLILKEAGGVILKPNGEDLGGAPLTVISRFSLISAANIDLYKEITDLL